DNPSPEHPNKSSKAINRPSAGNKQVLELVETDFGPLFNTTASRCRAIGMNITRLWQATGTALVPASGHRATNIPAQATLAMG
ncbi:hypothetical protein Q4595_29175, partial [Wenyingzhuangia sp. 1_MG-2023]|nr:hypothetical protein [Wenyingzhuangia sp. 1_MG-2023]